MSIVDAPDWSHARAEPHVKQKRARGQLSCVPCRVGKLKCNRVREPGCDQCIKRNREDACHYVPPPSKARPPANVKNRIRQLEGLVRNLMENQASGQLSTNTESSTSSTPSENEVMQDSELPEQKQSSNQQADRSFGKLDISQDEISYKGDHHWLTILSSLSEIQKDLDEPDSDTQLSPSLSGLGRSNNSHSSNTGNSPDDDTTSIQRPGIFGSAKAMTREELLHNLPDKRVADRLLSLWFNSPNPFKILIHAPTFQDEYKRLWRDQGVSNIWLGLFYSILCLTEAFGLRNIQLGTQEAIECSNKVDGYQSLAASAISLADITRPKEYTLECLMMYMLGVRGQNAALTSWLIIGLVVRLALRMGYHRDPTYYAAKVTAFEGEMRRRVWALVQTIDVLMSFQLGLPSMVRKVAADTSPPRNLLDRDFAVHSVILPPGRGDDELTPSLYMSSKLRIMAVFSEAAELSHATVPPTTEAVMKLDQDLEAAKTEMPSVLQMPGISEVITDPAEQLMCRFNLDLLYLKCKIVLFRRYMLVPLGKLSEQEQSRGIGLGREACVKSARKVLEHHHTIHNATQPGGQMEHMKWYMGSISTHDFLLAAMVICLEMSQQLQKDKMLKISNGMQCPTRQAMMRALEQTYQIWSMTANHPASATLHGQDMPQTYKDSNTFSDTEKARAAMAVMLAKLKAQDKSTQTGHSAHSTGDGGKSGQRQLFDNLGITPKRAGEHPAKSTPFFGVLSSPQWDTVPDAFVLQREAQSDPAASSDNSFMAIDPTSRNSVPSYDPAGMDGMPDLVGDVSDLDWQAWDHEIFNASLAQDVDWINQEQSIVASLASSAPQIDHALHGNITTSSGMPQRHPSSLPYQLTNQTNNTAQYAYG